MFGLETIGSGKSAEDRRVKKKKKGLVNQSACQVVDIPEVILSSALPIIPLNSNSSASLCFVQHCNTETDHVILKLSL